jgi:uncharacterized protein YecE (DUF72 family)
VELDSFFYHLPKPEMVQKMVRRTRKEFKFTVKLHRSITHEFDLSAAEFSGFLRATTPLVEAGRLGSVLAQFPPAFQCTRDAVRTLRTIREELAELPLAVEFRHKSWNRPETFDFLRKEHIAYCAVDEPNVEYLMPAEMNESVMVTAANAYIRMHGRSRSRWLQARSAAERHRYDYSEKELEEWAVRIEEVQTRAANVFVMFSNVPEAKAAANARWLANRLGIPASHSAKRPETTEQTEMLLAS